LVQITCGTSGGFVPARRTLSQAVISHKQVRRRAREVPNPFHHRITSNYRSRGRVRSRAARAAPPVTNCPREPRNTICARAGVKGAPGPTGSRRARLLTAIPKKTTSFFLQPVQMRAAREPDTKIAQKREASQKTRGEPGRASPKKERDATTTRAGILSAK